MKIIATLKKPYIEEQKMEFIVNYNHNLQCQIKETDVELQALGFSDEEIEEQQKQARNAEIDSKIKELQIMALPEVLNGNIENIKLYNEVIDGLEKARP